MLSGRRKKDYAAESSAEALEHQAEAYGIPAAGSDTSEAGGAFATADEDEEEEAAVAAA